MADFRVELCGAFCGEEACANDDHELAFFTCGWKGTNLCKLHIILFYVHYIYIYDKRKAGRAI